MAQQATVTLDHQPGLHIRAAMLLVSRAQGFESTVTVSYRGQEADAKSIYALVQLCALPPAELIVRSEGPDEVAACQTIVDIIKSGFREDLNGD